MAMNTDAALRRSVIYEIYVRSHTPEGTFRAIEPDLDRIAALGVDIVWFMPIHPIGELNKKGSLGCPYANRDYRTVNPEYGTLEDFLHLVEAIHQRGMKCIIDVVYNHTSPDSTLVTEHPDFFYYKPDGTRGNKVGDWTDVVDLDYENRGLWQYQINTLCYWAQYVDGFRCDVASTVPVAFWQEARRAVEQVRPDAIWLGESVHLAHIQAFRSMGFYAASDTELFTAFDNLLGWYRENGLFERYYNELSRLAVDHVLLAASVRVLRVDPESELLDRFQDYVQAQFPDYMENPYLQTLSRSHKLILRLLRQRKYRTVRMLFAVKDKLG